MKYDVTFSCGHEQEVQLFGKTSERERRISYLGKYCICDACKEAEKSKNCTAVEMLYSEYKNKYDGCQTKSGSYDRKTKTITVYIPIDGTEKGE